MARRSRSTPAALPSRARTTSRWARWTQRPAKSVGSLRLDVVPDKLATPADDTDVKMATSIKDVRCKVAISPCTGAELSTTPSRPRHDAPPVDRPLQRGVGDRPRDRAGRRRPVRPAFRMNVPCSATSDDTIGSLCALSTTATRSRRARREAAGARTGSCARSTSTTAATTATRPPTGNTLFMDEGSSSRNCEEPRQREPGRQRGSAPGQLQPEADRRIGLRLLELPLGETRRRHVGQVADQHDRERDQAERRRSRPRPSAAPTSARPGSRRARRGQRRATSTSRGRRRSASPWFPRRADRRARRRGTGRPARRPRTKPHR